MPRDPRQELPVPAEAVAPLETGEVDDMSWLQKLMSSRIRTEGTTAKGKVPEGLWEKCDGCGAVLYRPELERNLEVCPKCGHHHSISARKRLAAGGLLPESLQPVGGTAARRAGKKAAAFASADGHYGG